MSNIELIILAMVAGFIILRLRAELGNKTGNEPHPPHANKSLRAKQKGYDNSSIVEGTYEQQDATVIPLESDPELRSVFKKIHAADRNFKLDTFINGARTVYQMVLESFWKGDRNTLKTYLSKDVYNQFERAITARENAKHTLENKILDITDIKITEASLEGKNAEISVHFKAEIIAVTRDENGTAIDGNMSDAVILNDTWTFMRDTHSSDPSWLLIATRAG